MEKATQTVKVIGIQVHASVQLYVVEMKATLLVHSVWNNRSYTIAMKELVSEIISKESINNIKTIETNLSIF